jgi:hypothetical protein
VLTSRSRRDVIKLGTVATATLAVGAATTATASASECANLEEVRIPTAAGTFDAVAAGPRHGRKVLLHGFPGSASNGATSCARWAQPVTAP